VDANNRVFGYENLMICDGSTMPANPGVNPSLTITAIAEHAMAAVPVTPAVAGTERAVVSA
jgi:cholesterol oxidase